jgi:hypothetical protein
LSFTRRSSKGKLEAPKRLARTVHYLYFEPKYEEFKPRTIWSLSNALTSAFKELDPIPQNVVIDPVVLRYGAAVVTVASALGPSCVMLRPRPSHD